MSFVREMGLGVPTDITARMDFIDANGDVVNELDDNGEIIGTAWLEFYGPEAAPVKKFSRHLVAETMVEEKREQRSKKKKLPSESEMLNKLDDLERTQVEGMAIRLKAWNLVDENGKRMDVAPTKENAMALFGDPEFTYLRAAIIEFFKDETNFFSTKQTSSESSPKSTSKRKSAAKQTQAPTPA